MCNLMQKTPTVDISNKLLAKWHRNWWMKLAKCADDLKELLQ